MPSSRGSSQTRDQTHIPCGSYIAGIFFIPLSHEESTINMVLYLEKDLKFAFGRRKVAACVIVKWCKRVYPKWEGKLYLPVWIVMLLTHRTHGELVVV